MGVIVSRDLKTINVILGVLIFIGLPMLLYSLGDAPRRSLLKEAISLITLLAFSLMLGQFFLARSNEVVINLFDRKHIQNVHKAIAYPALIIFLVHPFLIVFPRYFEAGVDPVDALLVMLTSFDNRGILLGMVAWALLVIIALTAIFRMRLIKRYRIKYRDWRKFHGYLTVAFVVLAIWHAIELGRHTDRIMAAFFIALAIAGITLLFRLYFGAASKTVEIR